jgi:hypothetical protein
MSTENQTTASRSRVNYQSLGLIVIVMLTIVASGWALVVVNTAFETRPSEFVTLPTSPLSTTGAIVAFSKVSSVSSRGIAVGVKGYLLTSSGSPIAGANVYTTYYFQGSYRTQVAVTDANGYFEFPFHMNWTGWLPVTLTYYGDGEHRGFTQVASVLGENLVVKVLDSL